MSPQAQVPDEVAPDLRARRRHRSMLAAQRAAVALFERDGFDQVTVEQVADAAEVSPVSLYRWFGTKERLVLWDDYDPALFTEVATRLATAPPLEAVRDALVAGLDTIYDRDRDLVLRRTRLAHREPAVLAATAADMRDLRAALAGLFVDAGVGDDHHCDTLAGAVVGILVVAIDHWQRHGGARPLADWITAGFAALEASSWTS